MPTVAKKKLDPVERAAETIRQRKQRAIAEERQKLAAAERHTDWNYVPDDDPRLNEPEPGEGVTAAQPEAPDFAIGEIDENRIVMQIRIDDIQPSPHNPRQTFDPEALQELAESLREHGILQPLIVLPVIGGKHEIAFGERRYRAAKLAGFQTVPCIVQDYAGGDALSIDLARMKENEDRQDLNPIDEALAFERFTKAKTDGGHGLSQTELARRLDCTQSHISNRLRLLRLPVECRPMIIRGELSIDHARMLASVADYPNVILAALREKKKQPGWDLSYCLRKSLNEQFRPVRDWEGIEPKLAKRHAAELGLITLKIGSDDSTYATNTKRADELIAQAKQAEEALYSKSKPTANGKGQPVSAVRAKELAEQAQKTYAKRICRYLTAWYQARLLERLPTLPDHIAAAWFIWFGTISDGAYARAGTVNDLFSIKEDRKAYRDESARRLGALAKHPALNAKTAPPRALNETVIQLLKGWLSVSCEGYQTPIPPAVLWTLAKQAGVDLDRDWRLDAEFLGLHTLAQLHELNAELKIGIKGREELFSKKSEYLDLMLTAAGAKKLPLPRCLKNAEPVRLV